MTERPIYLDYHATSPCDPRVVEAMLPTFREAFGNASSRQHAYGREAEGLVETARGRVASLLGCEERDIVFTSGATEANNLALKGAVEMLRDRGRHIVTTRIEHKAVLDACQRLEASGIRVTYIAPQRDGCVRVEDIAKAMNDETLLVSVMLANNEIGTVQPISEIGALCRERGVLLHCDAAQALSHLDCRVDRLAVDLLSISGHKICGPKGVGALYVRRRRPRVRLRPLIDGGGHERGLRSGTLNLPGIVGLGAACEIVAREREEESLRIRSLRNRLLERIRAEIPEAIVNGSWEHRLPGNLSVTVPRLDVNRLLPAIPEVAVSSGAACASTSFDSSYVLQCLGEANAANYGALRFGLGRFTTADEVERAARLVTSAIRSLRDESPPPQAGDTCSGGGR